MASTKVLTFLVVFGILSVFRFSNVTMSVLTVGSLFEISTAIGKSGNSSDVEEQSTPSPPLPQWTDKLRPEESFTGYRYARTLQKNVPHKVSSSANNNVYESWIQLPLPPNNTAEAAFVKGKFSYAVIRDPLERLYSGYYNKCIKSPDYENHCTGWPPKLREANPPTLLQFLQRNFKTNFRVMHQNGHYKPITLLYPNLAQMDHVFHMSDSNFNRDIAHMWKRLGANHTQVDANFPVTKPRKKLEYESRVSLNTIAQHFADCETLHLGLEATKKDYHGKFAQKYFPTPQWALDKLEECGEEGKPQKKLAADNAKDTSERLAAARARAKARANNRKAKNQMQAGAKQ